MGSRRTFLLASVAATGGLVLGWSLLPPRQRLTTHQPLAVQPGQVALNGWLKIGSDDRVTVMVPKSEMGQGVLTALAMMVAEELDADWQRVGVEHPPVDAIYNNLAVAVDGLPFHPDNQGALRRGASWMTAKAMREVGVMATGGSTSVKDLWLPMRQAGASARAMLVAAAAAAWKVPAAEIRVHEGVISHPAGRSARFGAVAAAAAGQPVPDHVALKTPDKFSLLGKSQARLDTPAKVVGSAVFGLDVRPPGLLYAAVQMCPVLGGRVAAFDAAAAQALPGVKKALALAPHHGGSGGVAVVAARPWQAKTAVEQLKPQWDEGPLATLDSAALSQRLKQALDSDGGFAYFKAGDVDSAFTGAAKTLNAEFSAPLLAHSTMEPMNCTVLFEPGPQRATVWAPTQVPDLARKTAAAVLGLKPEQVQLNVTLLGGGFGRRLEVDFVAQAAEVARALPGQPVQTFWTREQDMQHDFYRPACVARLSAALDAQGRVLGFRAHSAGQAIVHQVMQRTFGLPAAGPDKTTAEGAFEQPYEWPAARVSHAIVDLPLQVGFWRSVGHSHQAFFQEAFIDELADGRGPGPGGVPLRTAAPAPAPPRGAAALRRAGRLGPAAAADTGRCETGPRRGPAPELRQHRGHGGAGLGGGGQDHPRAPGGQRHRLRLRGQPGRRARAGGKRRCLRPVGRVVWQRAAGQGPGATQQLPRPTGAADERMPRGADRNHGQR